jgi:hypothetical protein
MSLWTHARAIWCQILACSLVEQRSLHPSSGPSNTIALTINGGPTPKKDDPGLGRTRRSGASTWCSQPPTLCSNACPVPRSLKQLAKCSVELGHTIVPGVDRPDPDDYESRHPNEQARNRGRMPEQSGRLGIAGAQLEKTEEGHDGQGHFY